jgi:four helix bundle protein
MTTTENLEVFKRAHILTLYIYKITEKFPKSELFGLVSQMRRAAVSINSNLMEGAARRTTGEYKQFIGISRGSVEELLYQIMVARDLKYIPKLVADKTIGELRQIGKMLNGLTKKLVPGC